eukprot:SM000117S25473  [mRNA]  locus=s117:75274:77093:- [translate_table: standard]
MLAFDDLAFDWTTPDLQQQAAQMFSAAESLSPKVLKELARELKLLISSPPEGIRVAVNEDNVACVQADIDGPEQLLKVVLFSLAPRDGLKSHVLTSHCKVSQPARRSDTSHLLWVVCSKVGTPYDGGVFRMKLVLNQDYPHTPPKGFFLTRIFHPNIAKNGEICVNVLQKDWKSTLGIRHVLLVVRCLLIEPFPESALNEEAGKMLMEDYDGYAKHARLMTSIHAPKIRPRSTKLLDIAVAGCEPSLRGHTPLTEDMANKDGGAAEAVHQPTPSSPEATIAPGATSPPKKSKASNEVKVAVDKRKLDSRKKSLKRL